MGAEMSLTLPEQLRTPYQAQLAAIQECQNYFYKNGEESGFDSANGMAELRPSTLNELLEVIGFDSASSVDHAIKLGIQQYQYCHGGELPHPSVLATALDAGRTIANAVKKLSANALDAYVKLESGFDDVSNTHQESVSIVPAMTVATIATVIAYAMPIIAYIPNSNGSNEVPIVAVRFTTDRTFGAMHQGEYLDGVNASLTSDRDSRIRNSLRTKRSRTSF